jgi:hypothetical protein
VATQTAQSRLVTHGPSLSTRTTESWIWLVDVDGEVIARHTQPVGDRYALMTLLRRNEVIASHVLPDVELQVNEILP